MSQGPVSIQKLALLMARHSTVKLLHQSPLAFPRRRSQNIQQFICVAHSAKNFVFYTGGTVPTGPAVVPRSNESIHTSGSSFSRASSTSDGERACTHSKTNQGGINRLKSTRARVRTHATKHFSTSYKSYMSCTLQRFINI